MAMVVGCRVREKDTETVTVMKDGVVKSRTVNGVPQIISGN